MTSQPTLAVGIMTGLSINFRLGCPYQAGDILLPQGEYTAGKTGSTLWLQGVGLTVEAQDQLDLTPVEKPGCFDLKHVTIGIAFHWEQKEDQRFNGGLTFIPEEENIRAINNVLLEDYLKSVISSEMSATASAELLKAHAVISRSWLLAQMEKRKLISGSDKIYQTSTITPEEIVRWYDREDHHHFDVCADDHCQRYHGITKIVTGKAIAAVEATSGEILMAGNEICDARFSKCCGGISESFELVWEPEPKSYLTSITDRNPPGMPPVADLRSGHEASGWILSHPEAFCNNSNPEILRQILPGFDLKTTDFFRWRVEYRQEELAELVYKKSGIDFGKIMRLDALERGFSGRIVRLKITGTKQTMVVGKELEIRKWLSPSHLYSSAFVVEYGEMTGAVPGIIVFRGAGWGHGVGLCQIGAAVMGELNFSYQEILSHYFKNAELVKWYDVNG
jgi:peptidoglycan hydrolase-like amidase